MNKTLAFCGLTLAFFLSPTAFGAAKMQAKARAQQILCVSNLKQVALAFRIWSNDNGDKFPFEVKTNAGGTLEFCARDASGFEKDPTPHLLVLSNELTSPKLLMCPADDTRTRVTNWSKLTASNITYRVRTGPEVTGRPQEVLVMCPIHGYKEFMDGSTQQPARQGK